jgi:hypothetical protein
MAAFILRRLVGAVPLLLGIATIIFFVLHVAPGDPTALYLGPAVPPDMVEQLRRNLGLDEPLPVRYVRWMAAFFTGDFGFSLAQARPVGEIIVTTVWDRGGAPLRQERRATPRADGPEAMLDAVLAFAGELRDLGVKELGRPPAAAGVAVPGILDEAHGVVRYAANLGWRDVELRRLLSERLAGVPVALGHDVRTGGLAEGRLGAGAGTDRFFFVPLGTGIAGAIGIEGRI